MPASLFAEWAAGETAGTAGTESQNPSVSGALSATVAVPEALPRLGTAGTGPSRPHSGPMAPERAVPKVPSPNDEPGTENSFGNQFGSQGSRGSQANGDGAISCGAARAGHRGTEPVTAISTPETLLLRDGRRMHRFPAAAIPPVSSTFALALAYAARQHRAVLVADGPTLIVVEPKGSTLPRDTLARFPRSAGAIIVALRGEHRGRVETEAARVYAFDPPRTA
jgi:hypothetical protein